jgi:stearoyl-CoA 9-desaturase NADPH oxidoreductase
LSILDRVDRPNWQRIRTFADKLTTPLHPDDYLKLVNPLWSARELRGRLEDVVQETDDASTLVIRPGWGWSFDHEAGQYIGIGVEVDGRIQWRSYSLTSTPRRRGRRITVTVRAMPEGLLSGHLAQGMKPGAIVRLAAPAGEFVLPSPPPPKILFLVGGSGVTPMMSMLKTMDRRGTMSDVKVVYSSPTEERMIFRQAIADLAEKHETLDVHFRFTDADGMFTMEELDSVCPDWRERETWACGPGPMLDAAEEHFSDHDVEDHLHLERFTLELGDNAGEGGTISFQNSGKTQEVDGSTTLLEAGEEAGIGMPYGCRMGICHTCTLTLVSGSVTDVRNGDQFNQPNEQIQTCVTVANGDCTLNI